MVRNQSSWIALDCCERKRLSLNVFFGDTYETEILRATNFAANIGSIVASWVLLSERKASHRVGRRRA